MKAFIVAVTAFLFGMVAAVLIMEAMVSPPDHVERVTFQTMHQFRNCAVLRLKDGYGVHYFTTGNCKPMERID